MLCNIINFVPAGHACSLQLVESVEEVQTDPGLAESYGFGSYNLLAHIIQKN